MRSIGSSMTARDASCTFTNCASQPTRSAPTSARRFGRGPDGGRAQWLRVARGEADETIGHLRSNGVVKRIDKATFWRLRNRLITIIKMLNSLERL